MDLLRDVVSYFSLVLAIGAIAERPSYPQSSGGDEKILLKLQHDWAEARKKSDMAFLETFYASELQSEI